MTATVVNLRQLATFLHADIFESSYRPTLLQEFIKVDRYLYPVSVVQSTGMLVRRQASRKVTPWLSNGTYAWQPKATDR